MNDEPYFVGLSPQTLHNTNGILMLLAPWIHKNSLFHPNVVFSSKMHFGIQNTLFDEISFFNHKNAFQTSNTTFYGSGVPGTSKCHWYYVVFSSCQVFWIPKSPKMHFGVEILHFRKNAELSLVHCKCQKYTKFQLLAKCSPFWRFPQF